METLTGQVVHRDTRQIFSLHLQRLVKLDCFIPPSTHIHGSMELLLINDGQDLERLQLHEMLQSFYTNGELNPLLCVGIHAGEDRKMEYGTASCTDFAGRGGKASSYALFVLEELIPYIQETYNIPYFREKSFAGFSLGALSALDIAWNYPEEFHRIGVFSGSLWWRSKALEAGYNEETDRIMHAQVRAGEYAPWLKFFFEAGTEDETMDRNNNGIIDSIDDTLDLIKELEEKGYDRRKDITYLQIENGRHDVETWGEAMPAFLKWGWGKIFWFNDN